MIISKTPFRVSLFGGGTDYYEWFSGNKGAVIGFSINKYCYISFKELKFSPNNYRLVYSNIEQGKDFDKIRHIPFKKILQKYLKNQKSEINYFSDLPARSGVGSSSSFIVGLLSAIYHYKGINFNKKKLSLDAIKVEREVLKENVGYQDQIITSYGGMNLIEFKNKNDFDLKKIKINKHKK